MDENKEAFTNRQLQRVYDSIPDLRKAPTGIHLTDLEMAKYLNESLMDNELERIDLHLHGCANCAKKLERLYEEAPVFIKLLANADANVRKEAVQATNTLYSSPTEELQAALIALLSDTDAGVQQVTARVIATINIQVPEKTQPRLDQLLADAPLKDNKTETATANDSALNIVDIIKSALNGMVFRIPPRGVAFAADSDRNRYLHYTEILDGAARMSVEEDDKGNLIVRFSSYVVALEGTIVEAFSGDWKDKGVFDFVAPNQVGGKIIIPKNERQNMAKTEEITIKLHSDKNDISQ